MDPAAAASADEEKAAAAERAVARVREGMVVGLGTGSTAAHFVRGLGRRVRAGLSVRGIPTSRATEALAKDVGIPLVGFDVTTTIDLTVDGADEVGPDLALVKGGGGALLREKIVAAASRRVLIVADSGKVKETLGAFPLPVEVVPFGWQATAERLAALGSRVTLRRDRSGSPFVTDGGNHVLDCAFGAIPDPAGLARRVREVIGVVEHGLFVGLAHEVFVGADRGWTS
jgi:ribose 5-phosphate isomerase A